MISIFGPFRPFLHVVPNSESTNIQELLVKVSAKGFTVAAICHIGSTNIYAGEIPPGMPYTHLNAKVNGVALNAHPNLIQQVRREAYILEDQYHDPKSGLTMVLTSVNPVRAGACIAVLSGCAWYLPREYSRHGIHLRGTAEWAAALQTMRMLRNATPCYAQDDTGVLPSKFVDESTDEDEEKSYEDICTELADLRMELKQRDHEDWAFLQFKIEEYVGQARKSVRKADPIKSTDNATAEEDPKNHRCDSVDHNSSAQMNWHCTCCKTSAQRDDLLESISSVLRINNIERFYGEVQGLSALVKKVRKLHAIKEREDSRHGVSRAPKQSTLAEIPESEV